MATTLLARFPLGLYQAHRANGQPDPYPDTARLFSALVSAAGTGSTARLDGNRLSPSEDALDALRWLEANPPERLSLPHRERGSAVTAYRQDGVVEKGKLKGTGKLRVAEKSVGDATAFAGAVAWTWDHGMPALVQRTLDALCADVAYLGESDSPVVLEFGEATATHRLDVQAGVFATRGELVRTPETGRLDELERAHQGARPVRAPSVAADRHSFSESARPSLIAESSRVVQLRYVPLETESFTAPWSHGWLLPLESVIPKAEIVQWCVTLHRALAARIAEPAPAVITGHYAKGQAQPANRVAIHYINGSLFPFLNTEKPLECPGAMLVLFPAGGEPEDLHALEGALGGVRRLYRSKQSPFPVGQAITVDAACFWKEPRVGTVRLWSSAMPIVPETRPQPGSWSLADSAKLSVAFVARESLPAVAGRGEQRYRGLAEIVAEHGVRIGRTRKLSDSRVERYAHKLPDSLVAQPYEAVLNLGRLWHSQAVVALGQSRHLGGGLLRPLDVPGAATLLGNER